jgi:MinD-like ATPase involved in chromosome partitioning or flagellar assembly
VIWLTRVIGIVSGKGGVGKTTFAINLSIALTRFGKRVVVVDCNVTTPHLAYYIGADKYCITLNNVFRGEVDVKFAPLEHEGVMFIPASEDVKDLAKIDIMTLKTHIEKLSNDDFYDYVILDSAPGLGREAISVFQACEEVIFVTTPTIPTLTDVTRCAEVAGQMGHKRFNIVLNMVRNKNYELRALDAGNLFRTPILGTIPFDETVMDSTSLGIPFLSYKPDSVINDSYMRIAANLIGVKYEKPSKIHRISRRLKELFKRKKETV